MVCTTLLHFSFPRTNYNSYQHSVHPPYWAPKDMSIYKTSMLAMGMKPLSHLIDCEREIILLTPAVETARNLGFNNSDHRLSSQSMGPG